MSAGLLHLLIGSLGVAFATLILRADPKRWDNRAFAVLGYLDAAMALFRGVAASSGADISDRTVMVPCAGMAPLLAWASIEFAYSFPFSRRLSWAWRVPLLVATTAAMVLVWTLIDNEIAMLVVNFAFFVPASVIMLALLVRNLLRVDGERRAGVRLVALALALRWIAANVLYSLHPFVAHDTWALLLWIDSTVVVMASFMLIGSANVRSNLFTMRSAMGELALESAFVVAGLVLTAAAVDSALKLADVWPKVERPLLMVATLVPLAVFMIAARVRPRLEAGFDPRRALRREVLDRVLQPGDEPGDPDDTAAVACRTLIEVNAGGEARFVRDAIPPDGPDALVAPVRRGERTYGALVVTGGILDRETAAAATALADLVVRAFEHRRLLGELEESRRLAALGAFAAAIAHDIRTPLTSVKMNVQILRGKVALAADDMEYFEIALDELDRLERHVKELLDYAKPLQLHREPVTVQELADDAARAVEPVLAERGVAVRTAHAPDLPPVSLDPHRLRQVLCNLLDNAAKASPSGATIELRTRADAGRVAIDVVDTGAGIAPADLGRIFEPFFTTRPDGTGLGLAICQKVVKAHAGEIQVHSVPAAGSTFTVLLPA